MKDRPVTTARKELYMIVMDVHTAVVIGRGMTRKMYNIVSAADVDDD